jgi:pyruvate/2-oxoglutarate dehydrogenase complex dihydrolipoamide dehydrogenase (E3) component
VDVRLGVDLDAAGVTAVGADEVVVATGSRPPGAGFQRARPMVDRLPGSDDPSVTSIQAVLAGSTIVGPRVLVLDDLGDWRGLGTALHLVEAGHEVTIVTSAAVVAGGLFHSAADVPLRQRFARAGGRVVTSATVLAWTPGVATVESTLTSVTSELEADTLVIAETPVAVTDLAEALAAQGIPFHAVGDCVAPRRASLAFQEAGALARRL